MEFDETPGDMEERHDVGDEQRPFEGVVSLLPLGFTAVSVDPVWAGIL